MISKADLEKWDHDFVPLDSIKRPQDESNPKVGTCPKCGMELRRAMWFCCPNQECPVQIKPRY